MIRRFGLVVSMLWVLGPQVLRGQQRLGPGARVRIIDPPHVCMGSPVLLIGSFVRLDGDSVLIVDRDGVLRTVQLDGGRRLELSEGKRQRILEGVGAGLVLGAAIGAVVGFAKYSEPKCSGEPLCLDFGPGAWALAYAGRFALPGMLIGGVIGGIPREQWRRISGNHVTIAPGSTQGVHVGLSLAF